MDKNVNKRMPSAENIELTKKRREDEVPVTILNIECLMKICSTFSVSDLVCVAEAHGSLLEAAQGAFERNYSTSVIEVTNEFHPKSESTSFSVKLIKHFGAKITKLKVVYLKKYRRYNGMLDDMIIDRCTETLSDIEIENGDELVFHKIDIAFQELRKISFVSSDVPDILLNFEMWFPKANVLELKGLKIDKFTELKQRAAHEGNEARDSGSPESDSSGGYWYGKPIAVLAKHYPTVEHFAISNVSMVYKRDARDERLSNRDVEKFIKANPQLKSFFIETDDIDHECEDYLSEAGYSTFSYDGIEIDEHMVERIQQSLKSLENFHLIWKSGRYSEGFEIHFKRLSTLTVEYSIRGGRIRVTTDKVDVLNIVEEDNDPDSHAQIAHLLHGNKTAKSVTILGFGIKKTHVRNAFQIMANMPNLMELQLTHIELEKQVIISLLDSCKSLMKLTIDIGQYSPLYEASPRGIDSGIDLMSIGWALSSSKNAQLVLNRVNKT